MESEQKEDLAAKVLMNEATLEERQWLDNLLASDAEFRVEFEELRHLAKLMSQVGPAMGALDAPSVSIPAQRLTELLEVVRQTKEKQTANKRHVFWRLSGWLNALDWKQEKRDRKRIESESISYDARRLFAARQAVAFFSLFLMLTAIGAYLGQNLGWWPNIFPDRKASTNGAAGGSETRDGAVAGDPAAKVAQSTALFSLTIEAEPEDAIISLDGKAQTGSPAVFSNLTSGTYSLLVSHPEYEPFRNTELALSHSDQIGPIRLVPVKGVLNLETKPSGVASIIRNGIGEVAAQGTTPEPSLKLLPWTNSLGMVFVEVEGIWVCKWETRVQDYEAYAKSPGLYKPEMAYKDPGFSQKPTEPVVNVSWNSARDFCEWLTEQERAKGFLTRFQKYRLPTDKEWSVIIGLTNEPYANCEANDIYAQAETTPRLYPWGEQYADRRDFANIMQTDKGRTKPVGSYAPNANELFDLCGNVWEWCEDVFEINPDSKKPGIPSRVLRGGSFKTTGNKALLSGYRNSALQDYKAEDFGFRVVIQEKKPMPPMDIKVSN